MEKTIKESSTLKTTENGDVISCIMNIDNYKCDSSEDKKEEEENIEMVISE